MTGRPADKADATLCWEFSKLIVGEKVFQWLYNQETTLVRLTLIALNPKIQKRVRLTQKFRK